MPTSTQVSLVKFKKYLEDEHGWPNEKVLRFEMFCRSLGKVTQGGDPKNPRAMLENPSNLIEQFVKREGTCS